MIIESEIGCERLVVSRDVRPTQPEEEGTSMAKRLSEIEASAGPVVHTKSVGADGLSTEEAPKTTKKVKLTVIHPEGTVEQDQPTTMTEEQPQAEAPKQDLFKCSHHDERFPGEAIMLPLAAFPQTPDGKRKGVYCKRCQTKMHTAYQQRKREAYKGSVGYLEEQIAEKRTQLADLEEQLQAAVERESAEARAEA
jgi:hypothetical protein